MSVSTHITFLRDRAYHEQMLEAVKALAKVKVKKLPLELSAYFGTEDPQEALTDTDDLLEVSHTSIDNALEIDLDKLPKDVKHIRVSRS